MKTDGNSELEALDQANVEEPIPAELLAIVLDDIARGIRAEWKVELDAELRERARKGFFTR